MNTVGTTLGARMNFVRSRNREPISTAKRRSQTGIRCSDSSYGGFRESQSNGAFSCHKRGTSPSRRIKKRHFSDMSSAASDCDLAFVNDHTYRTADDHAHIVVSVSLSHNSLAGSILMQRARRDKPPRQCRIAGNRLLSADSCEQVGPVVRTLRLCL